MHNSILYHITHYLIYSCSTALRFLLFLNQFAFNYFFVSKLFKVSFSNVSPFILIFPRVAQRPDIMYNLFFTYELCLICPEVQGISYRHFLGLPLYTCSSQEELTNVRHVPLFNTHSMCKIASVDGCHLMNCSYHLAYCQILLHLWQ